MDSDIINEMGWLVGLASILIALLPMALFGADYKKSLVFLSIPPPGNNTISSNILITAQKVDVITMQINGDLFSQLVCLLAAVEAGLLWLKLRDVSMDDSLFTRSVVLRYGGLHTANSEFFLFILIHHVVLLMVAASPLSIHALLFLVVSYVALMFMLCEPAHDAGEENESKSFDEQRVNRVGLLFALVIVTFVLFAIDQRLNMSTIDSAGWTSGALFIQCFCDLAIVMVHASQHVSLVLCYLSRIAYVYVSAGTIIWWMCCW
jgi:hypothetical protein